MTDTQNTNTAPATLQDMTADKAPNAVTLNVQEIRQTIKALATDANKAHDNKESLVAKLAGIAAPYVQACESGYIEIRPMPAQEAKIDENGNVVLEGKPAYLNQVTVPARPAKHTDVAKFIKESLEIKPESLSEAGEALKSRLNYKNTTVDQTASIAAKAAILIARNADGMTVAYFVGNRAVPLKDGKAPKGATLRIAAPHKAIEPHLKFKGNPMVNPREDLVIVAPSQISTSWGANVEGKQRDAYGKIARGTKAGSSFDFGKAIGELLKALHKDAGDDTVPFADILHHAKALDNLCGTLDILMTKAAKEYPDEWSEAMGTTEAKAA